MSTRTRVLAALVAPALAVTGVGIGAVAPAVADPVVAPTDGTTAFTASADTVKNVGQVGNVWGTVATNESVPVWTEVLINGKWSTSQTGTTNSNGYYVLPMTYGSNSPGTYTFRVRATLDTGTVTTNQITVKRRHTPTANSASYKFTGYGANAWGDFDTTKAMKVWTEVWANGRWNTSQITQTNSSGYYVIPLTYGSTTPGTYTFRVRGQYSDGTIDTSKQFTLRRTGSPTANAATTKTVGQVGNAWGQFDTPGAIKVWSEVWANGRWNTSQVTQTNSSGSYVIPLTYGQNAAGTYTFRIRGQYSDGTIATTQHLTVKRVAQGKEAWMQAAGIPQSEWKYVDHIVSRESNWNPKARNPYTGACGLAQAYPCSKVGPNWDDPVVSLTWQHNYVKNRYGGYQGAYQHTVSRGWY